jgi:hypothetical protein
MRKGRAVKVNWGWVSKQLAESDASEDEKELIVDLLKRLNDGGLDDARFVTVLRTFGNLALGHAVAAPKGERWGPVVPGYYQIGDTVRVKLDAYDGEKGQRHNGKRGRAVAARNGLVVVVYDDASSSEEQYRHQPASLQRLM